MLPFALLSVFSEAGASRGPKVSRAAIFKSTPPKEGSSLSTQSPRCGDIVDCERSQPSPTPGLRALRRQLLASPLHQCLVGNDVHLGEAVKHVGRGVLDLSVFELAQIGIRNGVTGGLFDFSLARNPSPFADRTRRRRARWASPRRSGVLVSKLPPSFARSSSVLGRHSFQEFEEIAARREDESRVFGDDGLVGLHRACEFVERDGVRALVIG